jgi:hypothetical protein
MFKGKKSPFIVGASGNIKINPEKIMQSFIVLKRVVHIVTTGIFNGLTL